MAHLDGLTLAIESATYDASCALFRGHELSGEARVNTREKRGEPLLPAIFQVLESASVAPAQLERIVCGAGPGSFTSLRVGAATAKGLAMALGVPLLAAPSLALIVSGAGSGAVAGTGAGTDAGAGGETELGPGLYLAVLNAMRGELFSLLVEKRSDGEVCSRGQVELIAAREAQARARSLGARLAGSDARAPLDLVPLARGVSALAQGELVQVDLSSWEPGYGRLAEAQVKWESSHGRSLEVR